MLSIRDFQQPSPGFFLKSLILGWVLLFPFGCSSALAAATEEQIQFDPFLGHDQILREASWFPLMFELKNNGPGFQGIIEVRAGNFGGSSVRRTAVELPTGTQKRVLFPIYCNSRFGSTYQVKLLDEKGKIRAETSGLQPRRQVGSEVAILGSLGKTAGGAPVFPSVPNRQAETQPMVSRLQPGLFPDNPIVLDMLDTIYLHAERARDLKVTQEKALVSWLSAGGHLVLAIEQPSDLNANPFLRALAPCEATGTAIITAQDNFYGWLEDQPVVEGRRPPTRRRQPLAALPSVRDQAFSEAALPVVTVRNRDGVVLAGSSERPLMLRAYRDRGTVTVLLFNPEIEPFRSWKGRELFWARLAGIPFSRFTAEENNNFSGYSLDGVFGSMVETTQVRKLPLPALLMLLIIYLLVIGPLDRYWLKKIGREMLTWITFPCYVAAFSGLIYLIGYKLRAGDSEWNELHLLDIFPRGEQSELRGKTFGSLYSPANASYRFTADRGMATLRGEFSGNYNPGREQEGLIVQQGNGFTAEMEVPVWTSQLFVSDWSIPGPTPLSAQVRTRGGGWEVELENLLPKALNEVHLVMDDLIFRIENLGPREKRKLNLRREQGKSLETFVDQHGQQFETVVSTRRHAVGSDFRLVNPIHSSMAASFSSRLNRGEYTRFIAGDGVDLSALPERGMAVIMGWAPGFSPGKNLNQFSPRRQQANTLLRLSVPIQTAAAP